MPAESSAARSPSPFLFRRFIACRDTCEKGKFSTIRWHRAKPSIRLPPPVLRLVDPAKSFRDAASRARGRKRARPPDRVGGADGLKGCNVGRQVFYLFRLGLLLLRFDALVLLVGLAEGSGPKEAARDARRGPWCPGTPSALPPVPPGPGARVP
ncbi:hypothetical protein M885DRAFT_534007 [Pelagophyceae sp. CCMP2097]|nr:hypothetical protein M885DRAFT_534007 [Pelagophyceae sp. CCMP2097]